MISFTFASAVATARRLLAPVALGLSLVGGSLGVSNVASADEVVVRAPGAVVGAPRLVARRPFVRRAWRGRYWGPGYAPRGYAWGRGGFHGGRGFGGRGFHGGGRGGFHGGGGGGFHGGGHGGGHGR